MKLKELLRRLPNAMLVTIARDTQIGTSKKRPNFVTLPFESEPITVKDLKKLTGGSHISNAEYVVEATSMTGAFYMFEQSHEAAKVRQFIKDGYYKMHCHRKYTYTYTKGTEPPASDSSS